MTRSAYSLEAKRSFAGEMRNRPTLAEFVLWQRLQGKQTGFVFHRQSVQRGYILDFYCPRLKLAIEVDGSVHRMWPDARKDQALAERGIRVLRFSNRYVLDFCPRVMRRILAEISAVGGGL